MDTAHIRRPAAKLAAAIALILLIPLVAMQFTSEVSWGAGDFLAAAVLLFGAGMAYLLPSRRVRRGAPRLAVGLVVAVVLALVWAELAVGIFG